MGNFNSKFNTGLNTVCGKYYVKADKYYSMLYWAYLVLSILTLATMVIPSIIATLLNYFKYEEMTSDQWIIPFYFA